MKTEERTLLLKGAPCGFSVHQNYYFDWFLLKVKYHKQWRLLKGNTKRAAAALGKGRYQTACKYLIKEPKFRQAMSNNIKSIVREECNSMISTKFQSNFRVNDLEDLKRVKIDALEQEMREQAPYIFNTLKSIATRARRNDKRKATIRAVIAFSILISQRNKNMNTIQKLISVLLLTAKARTKVCETVRRLSREQLSGKSSRKHLKFEASKSYLKIRL